MEELGTILHMILCLKVFSVYRFLNDLIDAVHEELRKHQHNSLGDTGEPASEREENPADETENTNNTTANRTSKLPTDDFRLTMEVSLRCESCGYSRSKQEMYRHLSLDIVSDNGNQKGSIPTSLNKFFEPQVLEIRCEKCANGTHASQRMKILSRYAFFAFCDTIKVQLASHSFLNFFHQSEILAAASQAFYFRRDANS